MAMEQRRTTPPRNSLSAGVSGAAINPTTHLVAIVDDLTDMLDFDSEDIDGMDDDAGDKQEPAPTGHWKATSSYDIYMVDIPKGSYNEEKRDVAKDNSPNKQPKRRADAALSPASTKIAVLMTQQ